MTPEIQPTTYAPPAELEAVENELAELRIDLDNQAEALREVEATGAVDEKTAAKHAKIQSRIVLIQKRIEALELERPRAELVRLYRNYRIADALHVQAGIELEEVTNKTREAFAPLIDPRELDDVVKKSVAVIAAADASMDAYRVMDRAMKDAWEYARRNYLNELLKKLESGECPIQ